MNNFRVFTKSVSLQSLIFVTRDPQHAHVSRGEVIGLLGGTFKDEEKVLKVGAWEGTLGWILLADVMDQSLCVCA